jgi:hypothetical protein
MTFSISVNASESGSLESEMLASSLTGESSSELSLVDPMVIRWSGTVRSVRIFSAGKSHRLLDITTVMTADVPQFLELSFVPFRFDFSQPYLVCMDLMAVILIVMVLRVCLVRRQMRQRSMKEDEEVPVIHASDEYPATSVSYVSCASTDGLAPILVDANSDSV